MLRIAIFLLYFGGGGAERVLLNLGCGLAEQGFQIDLVLGKAWGPHLKKVPPQIRIVDLQASQTLASLLALSRYLRQERPLALLSAMHYGNEMALWAKRLARVSTRVIVTEHNTLSQSLRNKTKLKNRLIPLCVRYFYPWADEIVAVSQGVARDLARISGLPCKRIQTIYNPVVTPELLEKAKAPLDHPWFKPGEPPVILGVGKLEAQKDFPTLLRAFALVRRVRPSRLIILGWGPDRSQLEALIRDLGTEEDVALLGYVENPYNYMAHASVFALSSAWEGLPTVLVEAMALGTPVVSTDCESGPSEILDDNRYGILTPVGDPQGLANGILEIFSGRSRKVDPNWLKQFELDASVKQYIRVIAGRKISLG